MSDYPDVTTAPAPNLLLETQPPNKDKRSGQFWPREICLLFPDKCSQRKEFTWADTLPIYWVLGGIQLK